jgi:protein SDA1
MTTHGEDEGSGDEDEAGAWEGWEIESDSSDDSSDSGGWIDVESDGEDHLNVSDSDGEDGKSGDKLRKDDGPASDANRTSTLATTKV